MDKEKKKDFQEEYNRLNKEIEEQLQAGAFAQSNIDNVIKMILIPHYRAEAEMRWQDEYPRGSEEFNKHVEYDVDSAKLWIDAYVSDRKKLETERPFKNPDSPDWDLLEDDLNFAKKNYPDIEKHIGNYVTNLTQAFLKHKELTEELQELLNGTKEDEEPVIDASTEISNIQQKTEKQVEQVTQTPPSDGHVYPVALVQSWTNEMKNYNDQLTNYLGMMNNINFDKVDRNWLKKQVLKFVSWLKVQLNKLKQKVINGLKGMMQPIKKAMGLLSPILSLPTDPLAILGWASSVVSVFTEPYTKVIQFISDFTTYTPPLVGAAASLSSNVATAPVKIIAKANELKGEGSEIIQEEIANAVQGLIFEAPGLGDLM